MRTWITLIVGVALAGAVVPHSAEAQTPRAKAKSRSKGAANAALTPEMKDFLGHMTGDHKKTDAAVEKYRAQDAETGDMTAMILEDPQVLNVKTDGDETTYTVRFKSGIASRTYDIHWKDKKITRIKQTAFDI